MVQIFKNTISSVSTLLSPELSKVNDIIIEKMQNPIEIIPTIGEHIINSGGKRIRPLLTILAAKALSYRGDKHILIAACIEFIHSATLLHDDVVDENNSRRGVDTSNHIWGNKASVLVGDYLFSKAFELMVKTDSLEILEILSKSSSIIAQGEVLQLSNTNNINISFDTYLDIITSKTASLFSAATRVAGVLSNAQDIPLENITNYGNNLGILFQIIDDILDYSGTEESLGKSIGTDLKEGKITLPIILILKECSSLEKKEIKRIFELLDQKDDDFDIILSYINKYDAIEKSKNIANAYLEKGIKNIKDLKTENTYSNLLIELLTSSIHRIN